LSQALTLFTTPVIYLYLDRLNARLNAAAHSRPSRRLDVPEMPATARAFAANSEG
jgi:hypothetical protein